MNSTDRLLCIAIYLCLADALVTLPNWQLEGNPVVLALGPVGMVAVKLLAATGLALTWFWFVRGEWTEVIARPLVWSLTALYGVVVVSNLLVLATVG